MRRVLRNLGEGVWAHYCPGCKTLHLIKTGLDGFGPMYWFNGNTNWPTFAPSINWSQTPIKVNGQRLFITCHYNLIDGWIQFANDCGHHFSSQRVLMPYISDALWPDEDLL